MPTVQGDLQRTETRDLGIEPLPQVEQQSSLKVNDNAAIYLNSTFLSPFSWGRVIGLTRAPLL
jgi:hypothetical protein